ncbi:MAG: TolC family protein [Symploca sp. SIO2C1]|nr:TolC family protein [Symploca sp. SIO2C1]
MLTLRYFMVIGVGAVISLNYVEPVYSKELLSLTKPISKQSESGYPKPAVAVTQEHPQETGEPALSSPTPSNLARESMEDEQSQPVVNSTDQITEVAAEENNTVRTYREGDIPEPPQTVSEFIVNIDAETTSTALQESTWQSLGLTISDSSESPLTSPINLSIYEPLRGTSTSLKEQPVQSLDTEQLLVQSPESEIPREVDLLVEEIPPLEFLNPSANPLLFPTKPNEVQIENTQAITLEQALELSQRNNRQFQIARLQLERAQFVLQQALAAEFPTASFIADIIRTDSAATELQNRLTGFTQDTVSTSFSPMLTLNYNIFTSGLRSASIRRAEEAIRFQQLDLERIFEQLRLDVSQAYYQLQLADAQVIINQAAVTNAEEVLRDAQLREQAGLGTKFDVLQQQVQLANFVQDLTNARRDQRVARRQIVNLLSLAQDAEVSAADPITVAGQWELSIDESIILAFKNRAELQQRLTERDIAEQDRLIALADIRPQVSVFATYDVLDVFDDDVGPADGFTIGARFTWNFFDGGSARARARQAETDIAIADTNFADTRNTIRFQVEQAFFDLKANEQNIQTATLAVKQAEESLRLSELRVGAGVGTQLEVINQQTELTRARNNLVSAILNYNIGLANLQRAISNLPDSKLFDLSY